MRFVTIIGHARAGAGRTQFGVALLAAAAAATLACGAVAQGIDATSVGQAPVVPAEFNGDLRALSSMPAPARIAPRFYRPRLPGPRQASKSVLPGAPAPSAPQAIVPLAPMPSPIQNFAGMSFTDGFCTGATFCGAGWPPDTNGEVGPNHYIEAVNDGYAIYSKTGTRLAAFSEDQLWAGTGAPLCDGSGQGDPVVVYDRRADRWILTHFAFASSAGPFYQCIAASKTSDPVSGGWWLYAVRMDPGSPIPAGYLNDYPKFAAWHDCIYMGSNEFQGFGPYKGSSFASFSRSDLYSGAALTWALGFLPYPTNNVFSMFPANDLGRGPNAAVPGTPAYFVMTSGSVFGIEVRKMTAGPNCGGGGSLSAATTIPTAQYNFNDLDSGIPEIPQPNTANTLDQIDDRAMQKPAYRRIGGTESLWFVHAVDPCTGVSCSTHGPTAIEWAQIDVTGGTISSTAVQQQVYAPADGLYRWIPSVAVDAQGNMAVGYSTSNGTAPNFPSIAYAGRLAGDPLNTLPQSEVKLIAGAGSQTNNCGSAPCQRWGDYSGMSLDPVDDCTFWYTNEYYDSQTSGTNGNWHTRIGSFKFPTCLAESTRVLVPDGSSEKQTFSAYPETRWFSMNVEPGKTYVIDTVDPTGDLTANAIGTLGVVGQDGINAPPEATVDCTNPPDNQRPPAVAVANDGLRCILRTATPTAGSLQNKRPVFVKVTRMDPATGGGSSFKIRAREATIYGRWFATGGNYDFHVEVENTTADPMCVEIARYPQSGLTYATSWSGAVATTPLNVPAFGANKIVFAHASATVGSDTEGTLRINACPSPTNFVAAGLHVSTYAFDQVANQYIYFFTSQANDGKTRSGF